MKTKSYILLMIAGCLLLQGCAAPKTHLNASANTPPAATGARLVSDTLYFGTSTPQGPLNEGQWNSFLGSVVTPLFPDGLTVWDARGQWRGKDGKIGKEKTKVLQLIHADSPQADQAVQQIIDTYKKEFSQDSVMKVRTPADVAF